MLLSGTAKQAAGRELSCSLRNVKSTEFAACSLLRNSRIVFKLFIDSARQFFKPIFAQAAKVESEPMRKAFYDTRAVDELDEDLGPSKSQRKRDSEAMQKLGQELARLPADQFERIDLPEDIREAIVEYQRMKSFGAMRRQMQLIGKLMRRLEADAVREAIDRATGESRAAVAAHHRAERARDAMLASDDALTGYVEQHPEVDVQRLRQLVRAARKEKEAAKPPKSARELYRLIHALELPPIALEADDGAQDASEQA